jgi:general secretion pathway protein D
MMQSHTLRTRDRRRAAGRRHGRLRERAALSARVSPRRSPATGTGRSSTSAAPSGRPEEADYVIALERAMISASQRHLDQARIFEVRGQLDEALREYRRASEYDPPNRQVASKVTETERKIRDQAEAAQPKSNLAQLRENARQIGPPPLFNLTQVLPGIRFTNASLRDILGSIGMSAGINVTFDNTFQDRQYSVQMDNSTLEEALSQITTANQLFYKVATPRSIMVIPDNVQKRGQYEEQVIRTFFISHSDATEIAQLVNTVIRVGGGQVAPSVVANKTANTITVRATTNVMAIIERLVEVNDNPRAEILVDVRFSRSTSRGPNSSDWTWAITRSRRCSRPSRTRAAAR